MQTSNREKILDAIIAIVERDGITAVTYDAVAAETRLTRGGLLYHFPSREALILAAHQHLAGQWETGMEKIAGGKADTVEPAERDTAYIESCAQMARRVELLMMLESAGEPDLDSLWQSVLDRWSPPVPEDDDPAALARFIARLAADGLWVHEAMSSRPLPTRLKQRVSRELVTMAQGTTRNTKMS
ncbi:TPA: TetR/AcrR family transcriptional regulator [Enterobacter asburiae]|nr:TetR/AcrR family transcriptional regulator [Enterobacter asburiae]